MTTSEIRRKHVVTLARRADSYDENPLETIEAAQKAMNSFYRLAGFSVNLFYINNDYDRYTRNLKNGRLEQMEKREEEWIKRVNKYLEQFHARAVFNGIYPSICDERHDGDKGCINDLMLTAWY